MAIRTQKKKKWHPIYAPNIFREKLIGETMATSPEALVGKKLYLNLMDLTDDPKKQNYKIIFKITKVEGEKAFTEIIGYEMLLTHVKRIMRKGIEKIEDSFIVQSKDNVKIQIKPLLLVKNKTKHSILTAIRKSTIDFISTELKKQNYDDFIQNIINNKSQKQLREVINKIYPLVACEFRVVKKL